MALNHTDHDTFRHYLLGKLTGDDLEAFEKQLLTDDEVFEELLAAEDDFVDQYVSDDLSREEREVFEKHFLITLERQQDLDFARTLRGFIKQKTPRPHWWAFGGNQAWVPRAAAAVVLVSFLAVLVYLTTRPTQNFATINLTASASTRSEGPQSTEVNLHGFGTLRINLKLPEGLTFATGYRAELINATGETTVNVIEHNTESVTVEIPASKLQPGQYALKLYAIDSGGFEQRIRDKYFFTVR